MEKNYLTNPKVTTLDLKSATPERKSSKMEVIKGGSFYTDIFVIALKTRYKQGNYIWGRVEDVSFRVIH